MSCGESAEGSEDFAYSSEKDGGKYVWGVGSEGIVNVVARTDIKEDVSLVLKA